MNKHLLTSVLVWAVAGIATAQTTDIAVPAGAVAGRFAVSPTRQVYFSQGNLQYTQSTGVWSFAEQQYDCLGTANTTTDAGGNTVVADKIDLFGWSSTDKDLAWGIPCAEMNDYTGTAFVDWGMNAISNGGNQPYQWRTLTCDEWLYLFQHNRWTVAEIDGTGMFGWVLVPDGAALPEDLTVEYLSDGNMAETETLKTYTPAQYGMNRYMQEDFLRLQAAGVVFLPFAGLCDDKGGITNVTTCGYYWSATHVTVDSPAAYNMVFGDKVSMAFFTYLYLKHSVRLVQNVPTETDLQDAREVRIYEYCEHNGLKDSIGVRPNDIQAIDLGLSVLWASCNVGATRPAEYGNHYAWGEVEPKERYEWTNYKYSDGNDEDFTKYTTLMTPTRKPDNKVLLEADDDAAHANWGGTWRMPTREECSELLKKCTWELQTVDGTDGYKVSSTTNGNSIFLPFAGFKSKTSSFMTGRAFTYISASLNEEDVASAWGIEYYATQPALASCSRDRGHSVRPVCTAAPEAEQCYTLTLQANGCETANVLTCRAGIYVKAKALPRDNHHFVRWSDGNTDNPRLLFMAYDMTLTAEFEEDEKLAVDNTTLNPTAEVRKIIRNGQVLILRNNKTYTLMGVEVE